MDTYKKRKKIHKLMSIDPHCFYCGKMVIWYKTNGNDKLPSNFATIEHLFDKYESKKRREAFKNWQNQTVIACLHCNQKRGEQRTREIPLEERRLRDKILQERKRLKITLSRDLFLKQALSDKDNYCH